VFLPPGRADDFRTDARAGNYECVLAAVGECDLPRLTAVGGDRQRHHWRHQPGGGAHGLESVWHLAGKDLLRRWAAAQHPIANVSVERALRDRTRPDVFVAHPTGWAVGLEFQVFSMPAEQLAIRTAKYHGSVGRQVPVVWLFGHRGPFAPAHEDTVGLPPAVEAAAAATGWALWLNPDEQQVATGWVHRRHPLTERPGEFYPDGPPTLEGPDRVRAGDVRAQVSVASLSECSLTPAGILTPAMRWLDDEQNSRDAHEEQLRAAARDAFERREQQRAADREAAARRAATTGVSQRYGPAERSRVSSAARVTEYLLGATTTCPGVPRGCRPSVELAVLVPAVGNGHGGVVVQAL